MDEKEELKREIEEHAAFVKSRREDIALLLVVNIKSHKAATFDCYDFETEFFSEEELNDFIQALDELNIFRDISYGEDEFITKIASGYFLDIKKKYKIVYNTTGSKRIRSRSALVPSICELYNMQYSSSDILTASILENKVHAFSFLDYYNFKIPQFWVYHNRYGWTNSNKPTQNLKLIAKPSNECASIGITEESVSLFTEKFEHRVMEQSKILNQPIIVQEFICGWEVEVPVFNLSNPIALSTVGIKFDNQFFLNDKFLSYESVCADNYSFYNFEEIDSEIARKIKKIASDSYKILDLSGTIRVDFRITEKGETYITDYNNSPHFTQFHSCAKAIEYFGLSYIDMFCLILYKSLKDMVISN